LKFGIFVHPKRPKVPLDRIVKQVQSAGMQYSQKDPDVAIVVGGDGTFGYYGRTLSVPLLFVGVSESGIVGSRARLAEAFYDDLAAALHDIEAGRYSVAEKKMLSIRFKKRTVDVLTDVYLERGVYAGCLRYATTVKPSGQSEFTDYAIGNGVIVSTSFGAGGYFSYPERLGPKGPKRFGDNRIGICHIIPTYLVRKGKGAAKFRYTVPINSTIRINLLRDADARLYGITAHSEGVSVRVGDTITLSTSRRSARIIKLRK
jgi:NAD+ kinase